MYRVERAVGISTALPSRWLTDCAGWVGVLITTAGSPALSHLPGTGYLGRVLKAGVGGRVTEPLELLSPTGLGLGTGAGSYKGI